MPLDLTKKYIFNRPQSVYLSGRILDIGVGTRVDPNDSFLDPSILHSLHELGALVTEESFSASHGYATVTPIGEPKTSATVEPVKELLAGYDPSGGKIANVTPIPPGPNEHVTADAPKASDTLPEGGAKPLPLINAGVQTSTDPKSESKKAPSRPAGQAVPDVAISGGSAKIAAAIDVDKPAT